MTPDGPGAAAGYLLIIAFCLAWRGVQILIRRARIRYRAEIERRAREIAAELTVPSNVIRLPQPRPSRPTASRSTP